MRRLGLLALICAVFAMSDANAVEIRDADSAMTQFCRHPRPAGPADQAPSSPEEVRFCRSHFLALDGGDVWYVKPKPEYLRRNSAGMVLGYPIFSVAKSDGVIRVSSIVN
jgi:hypothetical protein